MYSSQEPTVDELFEAIVDLSDREQHDYLDQVGVSRETRQEVLALVQADVDSPRDSNLYSAMPDMNVARLLPDEFAADYMIGQDLGPYRIHDVIGIGGFGTVYQAFRRDHFEQRVAIKVVRADRSMSQEHRLRFEVERSVLARLEHPNIARLIDGGCTDDGRSYFVMEYIDGRPLAEYCDANKLTITDRVKLFLSICDATAHAHQQGIVHRDLKPGNILVLEGGTPKLIDFGIAKIVSDWNLYGKNATRTGDILMTPQYASPEQVCGEPVSAASDVYALGVILYELLTGCLPIEFESRQSVEIVHDILNRHPDPPSQALQRRFLGADQQQLKQILTARGTSLSRLQRQLRGDLDRIASMALRKEPGRRYRSAAELHSDIQNYLEDRPVRARGDSIAYRSSKFVKRYAAAVAITCALLLLCALLVQHFWREEEEYLRKVIERMEQYSFDQYFDGYVELQELLKEHPHHPGLNERLDDFIAESTVRTSTENVKVWIRPALQPVREWYFVGTTPLDKVRLPKANLQWRIQDSSGTEFVVLRRHYHSREIELSFPHEQKAPAGMVKLTIGDDRTSYIPINGEQQQIDGEIFFDRFEVTNGQFQRFVDAGGYALENSAWWPQFEKEGKEIRFIDAVDQFRDQTKEYGPGNWRHGRFPAGEVDYPVRAISWYEAMAYAKFSGKLLPSIFHWGKAAKFLRTHSVVVMSNIQDGPSTSGRLDGSGRREVFAVGSSAGVGVYGTSDMAGNVREWCFNATPDGRRYALGGSFNDVSYMYFFPNALSAWHRSLETGFRCMSFSGDAPPSFGKTLRTIDGVTRDFSKIEPIWTDDAFEKTKAFFAYDKTNLESEIEDDVVDERRLLGFDSKRAKRIVFNAAYEGPLQEITGTLYLPDPDLYPPPYQTIIHFPGVYALHGISPPQCLYLVNSGRAIFQPDYWATGARIRDDFQSAQPRKSSKYMDAITKIVMDFSRSIDVLEEIDLVDQDNLGYHGTSWGAVLGPVLLAVDNRCRAAVLMGGGLTQTETYSVMEQSNFCPHVDCPILMINGRHDAGFPPAAQRAMFQLFPKEEGHDWKILEASHFPNPVDREKHARQWFDKHLGPVQPKLFRP